jgi:hypothetical protein
MAAALLSSLSLCVCVCLCVFMFHDSSDALNTMTPPFSRGRPSCKALVALFLLVGTLTCYDLDALLHHRLSLG